MALSIENINKFDIFISYAKDLESKIKKLYQHMITKYDTTICLSKIQKISTEIDYAKCLNIIRNIEIFICCITRMYLDEQKIRSHVSIAFSQQKPIVILLFENLKIQDLGDIFYVLETSHTCKLFDTMKLDWNWNDLLIEKVINSIESKLGSKLVIFSDPSGYEIKKKQARQVNFMSKLKTSTVATASKDKVKQVKNMTTVVTGILNKTESVFGGDQVQTSTIITLTTEELIGQLSNNCENKLRHVDASKIKLSLVKSSLLLSTTFGFNRIKWIDTKNRYILTSSYTHVLVSIDEIGNSIDKRNPSGILRRPWAIYFHKKSQEIYVGDNHYHLVFVFDVNLKFLKKFGEKLFNYIFDMSLDEVKNDLYTVDMFEGLLQVLNLNSMKIIYKIYLNAPTYVHLNETKIFVISATDLIYVIDKSSFQVNVTISMDNTRYISGLYVDSRNNIFTTSHQIDEYDNKSKEVFLNVVNLVGKMETKRINLNVTQCTDFCINSNRLVIINDTNADVFEIDLKNIN